MTVVGWEVVAGCGLAAEVTGVGVRCGCLGCSIVVSRYMLMCYIILFNINLLISY